jgi:dihydrofolate reductase
MILSLIVAMDGQGVIGREGRLPWHLPDDLRRFKSLTLGHPVIMGRKTFASIGRPLPGRTNIVITRSEHWTAPAGVVVVDSLDAAIARCTGAEEVFVIGGESIYRLALARADRLYVTRVHASVEGDARFPDPDLTGWKLASEEHHRADARHAHGFTFQVYERLGR